VRSICSKPELQHFDSDEEKRAFLQLWQQLMKETQVLESAEVQASVLSSKITPSREAAQRSKESVLVVIGQCEELLPTLAQHQVANVAFYTTVTLTKRLHHHDDAPRLHFGEFFEASHTLEEMPTTEFAEFRHIYRFKYGMKFTVNADIAYVWLVCDHFWVTILDNKHLKLDLHAEAFLPLSPLPYGFFLLRKLSSYRCDNCLFINTHVTADIRNRIQFHQHF
jgi:hypothetical protein